MTYGAVAGGYYHENAYYNQDTNAYYNAEQTSANHEIAIVGWDDNFSKSNFAGTQPKEDGAWLIRNSWGSAGDEMNLWGYFWMSYEDISLNSYPAFVFETEPASNYDHNYQYDGSIWPQTISMPDSITAANVFTAKGSAWEELKAVSFVAYNTEANYTVKVYKNLTDASNPESGTLISEATTTGTTAFYGTYTVKLNESVYLKEGDTFATVVELEDPGYQVGIEVEASETVWDAVACVASAKEGQSFYMSAKGWKDFGERYDANIRIKAYTCDTEAPTNGTLISTCNGNSFYLGDDGKLRCYDNNYKMIIDSFVFDGSYTYYMQMEWIMDMLVMMEHLLRQDFPMIRTAEWCFIIGTVW